MKRPRFPAVALLVIAAVVACSRPPITAAQLAAETSKRANLPLELGDGLRLDSITAEGNAVVSTVTMSDDGVAADPAFKDVMRAATTSDICREIAPAKQAYVDAGIRIAKLYPDARAAEILRVDVRPADCA